MSSDSDTDEARGDFSRFSLRSNNTTGNSSRLERSSACDTLASVANNSDDESFIGVKTIRRKMIVESDSESESGADESIKEHKSIEDKRSPRVNKRNVIESDSDSEENDRGDNDSNEADVSKEEGQSSINDSMMINQKRLVMHFSSRIYIWQAEWTRRWSFVFNMYFSISVELFGHSGDGRRRDR